MIAHIGGLPIEETIAMAGPALLLAFWAVSATLRARLRRPRASATRRPSNPAGPLALVGKNPERVGVRLPTDR